MHLPLTRLPTPWDRTLSSSSTYLLGNTVGTDSVTFDRTQWSVDKGKGHVLEAGAGYKKAPMATQNDKVIPVRRPLNAPLRKGKKKLRRNLTKLLKAKRDVESVPQRFLLSTPSLGHMGWKQPTQIAFFPTLTKQFSLGVTCSLNETLENVIMVTIFRFLAGKFPPPFSFFLPFNLLGDVLHGDYS